MNNNTNTGSTIREIMNMAKDAYYNTLNETTRLMKATYGINPAFLKDAIKFSLEDLEGYDEDALRKMYDLYYTGEPEYKYTNIEDIKTALVDCKKLSNTAFQTKEEYDKVQEVYDETVDTEWKRRNSKEYRDATLKRIDTWKEEIANMDPVKDSKTIRDLRGKLEFLESTITLDFIVDRIQHVDREKESIIRQFFSEREGGYAKNRCISRSAKFGFDANWYKYFFNLEENFLPEEYHVYNNLFLFNVMRFVGYQDPYNIKERGMVQAIINSLTGLIYHKFEDKGMEDMIIGLIEQYDSYFFDYREKFEKDNTTHPNHPVRISYSKKLEADKRNELIASLQKFDLEVPENASTMSVKDLHAYFNHAMEEMVAKNAHEKELHGDAEAVEEDGIVKVRPTFLKDKYRNPVDCIDGKFYLKTKSERYQEEENFLQETLKELNFPRRNEMYELLDPDVPLEVNLEELDPEKLTEEEKDKVIAEMKQNFWYFWRYVLERGTSMAAFLAIDLETHRGISTWECFPRGVGSTTLNVAFTVWNYLFHQEDYVKFIVLTLNNELCDVYRVRVYNILNKLTWISDYKNMDEILYFTEFGDLANYLQDHRKELGDKKVYIRVDGMEFLNDANTFFSKEEYKDILDWGEIHITSCPNSPANVPFINRALETDMASITSLEEKPEKTIYRLYDTDPASGMTFSRSLKEDCIEEDPRKIYYVELSPNYISPKEEMDDLMKRNQSRIERDSACFYREIYVKRVTNEMIGWLKSKDPEIDLTDPDLHVSYLEYQNEINTSLEQEIEKYQNDIVESVPVVDRIEADPVKKLKAVMDKEGTMYVADYMQYVAGDTSKLSKDLKNSN